MASYLPARSGVLSRVENPGAGVSRGPGTTHKAGSDRRATGPQRPKTRTPRGRKPPPRWLCRLPRSRSVPRKRTPSSPDIHRNRRGPPHPRRDETPRTEPRVPRRGPENVCYEASQEIVTRRVPVAQRRTTLLRRYRCAFLRERSSAAKYSTGSPFLRCSSTTSGTFSLSRPTYQVPEG